MPLHPETPGTAPASLNEDVTLGFRFYRLLRRAFLAVLLLIILFVGIGFLLPKSYAAHGEIVIDMPAMTIYPLINNLENWSLWAPLPQRYPDLRTEYPLQRSFGTGAIMQWQSGQASKGRIKLINAYPFRSIQAELTTEGYEALPATLQFEFVREGSSTRLVYTYSGEVYDDPLNRWFGLLIEAAAKAEYDKALEALKAQAEKKRR